MCPPVSDNSVVHLGLSLTGGMPVRSGAWLTAPSVRWRRQVCVGGVECAVRAADHAGFRPTCTVKAITAHSIMRQHSRFGEQARYPPNAFHHSRFERRCVIGVPKTALG